MCPAMEGRRVLWRRVDYRQERLSTTGHRNRGLLQWLPRDRRVFGRQTGRRERRSEGRRHDHRDWFVPHAYGSVQMSRLSCVVALGGLMFFSPPAGAQGTLGNGGFQYYGITHVSWWFDEYTYASRSEEHTSELQSLRHLVC